MRFLINFLPSSCSRLNIFIAYSRAWTDVAREFHARLQNANARVFLDEVSIKDTEWESVLIRTLNASDIFVLLISREFLENETSYTRAEYNIARRIADKGRLTIIPVIVDPSVKVEELDEFLRARQVVEGPGALIPEVVDLIESARLVRRPCAITLGLAAVMAVAFVVWFIVPPLRPVDLAVPSQVQLRPLTAPPAYYPKSNRPEETGWLTSEPMLYAMSLNHKSLSDRAESVRVTASIAHFALDGISIDYTWHAFACQLEKQGCRGASGWLSTIGVARSFVLPAGAAKSQEVVYKPTLYEQHSYLEIIDLIRYSTASQFTVTIHSTVRYALGQIERAREMEIDCFIDLYEARTLIEDHFEEKKRYPYWLNLKCQNA